MNSDELYDYLETIETKEDFDKFLNLLLSDLQANGEEWENNSLESYLSGMITFSQGLKGYYSNVKKMALDDSKPTWRIMAEILMGATVHGN